MRKTNQDGIDLIRRFEGFKSEPYLCPAGVWTIGYGSTRGINEQTPPITEQQAEELLKRDLSSAEASVCRLIYVPLTDNQFAALVSFTFNLGGGALQRSTLRQKLNRGDYDSVPAELLKWCRAGGRKLNGLLRRRIAEGELFVH